MCFHHLDGFFNIAIFVSLKNSQMFLIDPSLDHVSRQYWLEKIEIPLRSRSADSASLELLQ